MIRRTKTSSYILGSEIETTNQVKNLYCFIRWQAGRKLFSHSQKNNWWEFWNNSLTSFLSRKLPVNFIAGTGLRSQSKIYKLFKLKLFFHSKRWRLFIQAICSPNKLVSVNSLNKWSVNFDQVVTDQFHDFRSGPDGQIIFGTSH